MDIIDLQNDSTGETFNKIINNIDELNRDNINLKNDLDNLSNNDISNLKDNISAINNNIKNLQNESNLLYKLSISSYDTVEELKNENELVYGQIIKVQGYFNKYDGGAATYIISDMKKNWSITLTSTAINADEDTEVYANIINSDFVNYKMFGAVLDGTTDDSAALNNAHSYCNEKKVLLKNNGGIIYKKNNTPINVKYNVDLTGSTLKVTSDNSNFYSIVNNDILLNDCTSTLIKSEYTKNANKFTLTDIPDNTVLLIKDSRSWDDKTTSSGLLANYRADILYNTSKGNCIGNLIYGYENSDSSLVGLYSSYNNERLTFKGCKVDIESLAKTNFKVIAVNRHNTMISDFNITVSDSILSNETLTGNIIYIYNAFNVNLKNIIGIGIEDTTRNYKNTIFIENCLSIEINNCYLNLNSGCLSLINCNKILINQCNLSRIDFYDYISNITIKNTTIYDYGINIGGGNGSFTIDNCKFMQLNSDLENENHFININTNYNQLFTGTISLNNSEIYKKDKDLILFNIGYIDNSTLSRIPLSIPDININNVKISNITDSDSDVIILNLSGESVYATSDTKIRKFKKISINSLSYINTDFSDKFIKLISDTSTQSMYSTDDFSEIIISNTVFSSDPIPDKILISATDYLTIDAATNNKVSITTDSVLFNKSKISLNNTKTTLNNSNTSLQVYIDNSKLYAFSQDINIPTFNNTCINNTSLKVFKCNLSTDKYTIPQGCYLNCLFETYKYLKSGSTTETTCTITSQDSAKVLNCNIS